MILFTTSTIVLTVLFIDQKEKEKTRKKKEKKQTVERKEKEKKRKEKKKKKEKNIQKKWGIEYSPPETNEIAALKLLSEMFKNKRTTQLRPDLENFRKVTNLNWKPIHHVETEKQIYNPCMIPKDGSILMRNDDRTSGEKISSYVVKLESGVLQNLPIYDFNKTEIFPIQHRDSASLKNPVFEDLRLVINSCDSNRVFVSGTALTTYNKTQMSTKMCILEYFPKDIEPPHLKLITLLDSPLKQTVEKNWILNYIGQNKKAINFKGLYSIDPEVQVLDIHVSTNHSEQNSVQLTVTDTLVIPKEWKNTFVKDSTVLRLSSFILLENEIFVLLHKKDPSRYYSHYGVFLDYNFKVVRYVYHPILVELGVKICFIMQMEILKMKKKIKFYLGVNDQLAGTVELPLSACEIVI